ncbi:tRNA uridine 5-oxyacetic acid(34) methyltransferase CmoM [Vibrio sp. SS-MA-C1-2]|uniref:tRNA uridine 5-oxyacetic acid(34) methyltransferase CmoM n=1 Tax=Vibrio sp. SS-MA-C1-2 TaxID=2908646 RepID=UPI001F47F29D|nr:tRNA uridine 5-oxyacetic acid(34) methyltransferase CmoM [Vibrio sp. SS-MA-C1-2]UJF16929.1 tRNA uridine 5-oxyacetic acid(34) methyltransferase CmoM [Vibrio sp. SS-MA-C1-2]
MAQDRNFDDIADKFAKNIYGSQKGLIREAVVWRDLQQIMDQFPQQSLSILDAGGGIGQMSQKMATQGHHVTLCDISAKMLQLAAAEIEKAQLMPQYQLIHCAAQDIDHYLSEKVDVILFHAVVEWLAEPQKAVESLIKNLKPGGYFSLMFYNNTGLTFKNLICGNIPHVIDGMPHRKRFKLQPTQAFDPDEVYQWLTDAGLEVSGKSGVRCIHDYIRQQDVGEYTFDQLLEMEMKLCQQEPYLSLGRYIHVWARKPI